MEIDIERYKESLTRLPEVGQHILAHQTQGLLVVYQAYKKSIADFAVKNQFLGGPDYSYSRMSWIKPNFLWMMYRCGWAEKENQERVLALWITRSDFEEILAKAVFSSFNKNYYGSHEHWRNHLQSGEVRLQWDPDHDPYGNKLQRRAIQLGLKEEALKTFGKDQIKRIEDITDFVKTQKQLLGNNGIEKLFIPVETVLKDFNPELRERIGISL